MREILFRGKRLDNNEWVYGDLLSHTKNGIPHIFTEDRHDYEIDINTIGQFTGTTDKNGEKIFEGDILLSKGTYYVSDFAMYKDGIQYDLFGYVKYRNYNFICSILKKVEDGCYPDGSKHYMEFYHSDFDFDSWSSFKYPIVWGNIFDNKEFFEECKMIDKEKADRDGLDVRP